MASVTRSASATAGDHSQTSDSTYSALSDGASNTSLGNMAALDAARCFMPGSSAVNVKSLRLDIKNWGFSIPSGATIDGVVAEVTGRSSASGRYNAEVQTRLVKGGSPTGDNKASGRSFGATTDATHTSGGATDLWGVSLTDSDVNASDFGLALQYRTDASNSSSARIDHVQLTVYYTEAGGGINAALSQTLGDLSGSASGQLLISGGVGATLGALTSAAAGQLPIAAALSQSLGSLSLTATGQLPIVGSLGQTLGGLSSSATGTLGNALTGALSQTLGALTVSAAGTLPINAALSQTLGTLTVVGAGVVPIVAQTAQTLGALTLASTGVLGATTSGVVTQTLGPLALSATARLPITAAVSQSLGALTSAAAGRVDIAAQLGVTLGNLQISATGSTGAPITAALAQTLGLLSLSATGGAAVVTVAPLSRITAGATRSNLSRGSRPPNLSGSGR